MCQVCISGGCSQEPWLKAGYGDSTWLWKSQVRTCMQKKDVRRQLTGAMPEARRILEEGQWAMPTPSVAHCLVSASFRQQQCANHTSSLSHPTFLQVLITALQHSVDINTASINLYEVIFLWNWGYSGVTMLSKRRGCSPFLCSDNRIWLWLQHDCALYWLWSHEEVAVIGAGCMSHKFVLARLAGFGHLGKGSKTSKWQKSDVKMSVQTFCRCPLMLTVQHVRDSTDITACNKRCCSKNCK